jgi:hypothetical protein
VVQVPDWRVLERVWEIDPRLARARLDPELAPASFRQLEREARGPERVSRSGRQSALARGSDSGRQRSPDWGAEPAWGAGIGSRIFPPRAKAAPPACRIAWLAATA